MSPQPSRGVKNFLFPAFVFHGMGCCVTHLYVRKFSQLDMKCVIIILFFFLCTCFNSNAQDISDLKKLISTADSIYLVSHVQTDCVKIVDDNGKQIDPEKYKIAYHGKLNLNVIEKMQRLLDNEKAKLIAIIMATNHDTIIETCNCFIPFHSIVVYNHGKVSYMDICFACNTYAVGIGNSRIENLYLGKAVMEKLYDFFIENKFLFENNSN